MASKTAAPVVIGEVYPGANFTTDEELIQAIVCITSRCFYVKRELNLIAVNVFFLMTNTRPSTAKQREIIPPPSWHHLFGQSFGCQFQNSWADGFESRWSKRFSFNANLSFTGYGLCSG